MAIITEAQAEGRLNNEKNLLRGKGRTPGAKNLPDSIRELVGFNAHFQGAKEVGTAFGIAPITAHLAKKAEGHPEVAKKIGEKLEDARDEALTKMMTAMGVVTVDKIQAISSTKGALKVAREFAHIIDKITPRTAAVPNAAQVIIYAPQVQEEKHYESVVIDAESSNA